MLAVSLCAHVLLLHGLLLVPLIPRYLIKSVPGDQPTFLPFDQYIIREPYKTSSRS